MTDSPWQRTVAPEVLARLHPRLRTYFGPVPAGHVGRGEGVFTVVGTPRRWLWPVLAVLARDGVRVSFRALGRECRARRLARRGPRAAGASPLSGPRPAAVSPRVTLTERFDDEADRQRVSLVLSAPILGTLYRYEGAFRYAIAPGQDGENDE